MGNSLTSSETRVVIFLALLSSSLIALIIGLPYAKKLLPTSTYAIGYYRYQPAPAILAASTTPVSGPPATAVPILMYHGVIDHRDAVNTPLPNFIAQMEALKKNGYSTISVHELDLFRQGQFILPPKPIILTFDDGRKDSYYPTDDILRQLGFRATIFVATGPIIDGNSFYLSWEDLKTMRASGRWEIEAHGRYSHEKIPIDPDGAKAGRYLTSRQYLASQQRLETVAEFEQRVEADYQNVISDLETHVGVTPRYFAIPLNDYGEQSLSNYPPSLDLNGRLIKKYFRLGFVQSNDNLNPSLIVAPIYNFSYTNPYSVYRLEVENLSAEELLKILDQQAPTSPQLTLAGADFNRAYFDPKRFTGKILYLPNGLSLTAEKPAANGQIVFGEDYWRDYEATATIAQSTGRSIVLLFNCQDQKNYLAFGRTDNSYFLRETVNNTTRDLIPPYRPPTAASATEPVVLSISAKAGLVSGSVNGTEIFSRVAVSLRNGAVGFKVWGNTTPGSGILQQLTVKKI